MRKKTIHVYLLDEGVDVWRPVESEEIGNDIFRIPAGVTIPEGENWEFQPGDLVRCELKTLSKRSEVEASLVAVEKIEEEST
jgi:hypothetical protein